jgi:hypothetical protein
VVGVVGVESIGWKGRDYRLAFPERSTFFINPFTAELSEIYFIVFYFHYNL